MRTGVWSCVATVLVAAAACASPDVAAPAGAPQVAAVTSPSPARPAHSSPTPALPAAESTVTAPPAAPAVDVPSPMASQPPAWLGTRALGPAGSGPVAARPTPPELRDRRIVTADVLPPPDDDAFHGEVAPVPPEVLARSTWTSDCPVAADDLRYVTVTFRGFDGHAHTGELLVHRDVASDVVAVFERLFAVDFPIEEMRIARPDVLDAPPTGDGNVTGAFVCRPMVGSASWSEHAYGRAVDVNPFHNPYVDGETVVPELATAYTDRTDLRPGMILPESPVVEAFAAAGWSWGGQWRSHQDPMHFSSTGR